ncbi:MAG: hypothetical protein SFY80_13940 [Verrucomicrobiota bacterium]|nr:hypothetical protein [Verrucomicrobiota bacterium]
MAEPISEISPRVPVFLGLAYEVRTGQGRIRIVPEYRRIVLAICLLATLFWAGKTVGLYYFFLKYKKYDRVQLDSMILYPFNDEEIRKNFGDYNIEQAIELLKKSKYQEASYQARVGLVRSPGNIEGRQIVAQYELGSGQSRSAIKLLMDGFEYAPDDIKYLRSVLQVLLNQRADNEVLQLARDRLPSTPKQSTYNKILAIGAAQSSFLRGSFDEAVRLIRDYNLEQTIEGIVLYSQIDWNRGQRKIAIDRLETFLEGKPIKLMDPIYSVLSNFYREEGDTLKARRYITARATNNPFAAQPRIELLYFYAKDSEKDKMDREADTIINQFKNDQNALVSLARFATDTGQIDLARRVYEVALENNFSVGTFGLLYIEAHVVSHNYQGAIDFCSELVKENPFWLAQPMNEVAFNSLRSIAYYGLGNNELGDLYLEKFSQVRNSPVTTLISVARRYKDMGLNDQARGILAIAYQRDPENQIALSGIIEIDLDQGSSRDLSDNLRKLLNLRRPSYDLMKRAYVQLNSDRFIFAKDRDSLLIELRSVIQETSTVEKPA